MGSFTILISFLQPVYHHSLDSCMSTSFRELKTCSAQPLPVQGCRLIFRIHKPTDSQTADYPRPPEQLSVELDTYDSAWTIRSSEPELEESILNEVEIPVNAPGD